MSERESIDKPLGALIARRSQAHTLDGGGVSAPASAAVQPAIAREAVDNVSCRVGDASCAGAHAGALSRSMKVDGASTQRSLLKLQRRYGNQYVGRVIDRASSGGKPAQDMAAVERSIDTARGSGHGMDHSTRTHMETAFGADFSGVRIHTDTRADGLNRSLSARAFTTGRDVFFRQSEYSPGTSSGRELLAHELTHVVQQGDSHGVVQRDGDPNAPAQQPPASAPLELLPTPPTSALPTRTVSLLTWNPASDAARRAVRSCTVQMKANTNSAWLSGSVSWPQ